MKFDFTIEGELHVKDNEEKERVRDFLYKVLCADPTIDFDSVYIKMEEA